MVFDVRIVTGFLRHFQARFGIRFGRFTVALLGGNLAPEVVCPVFFVGLHHFVGPFAGLFQVAVGVKIIVGGCRKHARLGISLSRFGLNLGHNLSIGVCFYTELDLCIFPPDGYVGSRRRKVSKFDGKKFSGSCQLFYFRRKAHKIFGLFVRKRPK